jgi:hypothetical protein
MTVATLLQTMTPREFGDWVAWYSEQNEQAERERREHAGVQQRAGGGFSLDLTTDAGIAQLSTAFKGKG